MIYYYRYRFYTICPIFLGGEKIFWLHLNDKGNDY